MSQKCGAGDLHGSASPSSCPLLLTPRAVLCDQEAAAPAAGRRDLPSWRACSRTRLGPAPWHAEVEPLLLALVPLLRAPPQRAARASSGAPCRLASSPKQPAQAAGCTRLLEVVSRAAAMAGLSPRSIDPAGKVSTPGCLRLSISRRRSRPDGTQWCAAGPAKARTTRSALGEPAAGSGWLS